MAERDMRTCLRKTDRPAMTVLTAARALAIILHQNERILGATWNAGGQ